MKIKWNPHRSMSKIRGVIRRGGQLTYPTCRSLSIGQMERAVTFLVIGALRGEPLSCTAVPDIMASMDKRCGELGVDIDRFNAILVNRFDCVFNGLRVIDRHATDEMTLKTLVHKITEQVVRKFKNQEGIVYV